MSNYQLEKQENAITAVIKTTMGDITVQLFSEKAPQKTVTTTASSSTE